MVNNVSKIYRRIMTSNEVKAFLIFEKCEEDLKEEVKQKLETNGSIHAKKILSKLQNI